ncbi:MAG: hypothetical protein V3R84_01160 [Acidimicrobiia bacterium]
MSESAERIYALLVDVNPVPDIEDLQTALAETPHLYVIDTRRNDMQTQTPPRTPASTPPRRRRLWIPALAGAAVVVATVIVSVFAFGGNDSASAPVAQGDGPDLIKVVEDMYADGTVEGTLRYVAEDASSAVITQIFGRPGTYAIDDPRELLSVTFALNAEAEVTECTLFENETAVRCTARHRDDFHGPAGLEFEVEETFRFDEAGRIMDVSALVDPRIYQAMDRAFGSWLQAEHPEIHAETSDSFGLIFTEEAIAAFLPFVEDFVAQSPDYPVTE